MDGKPIDSVAPKRRRRHPEWVAAYVSGRTAPEIAEEAGTSAAYVTTYLHRHRDEVAVAEETFFRALVEGLAATVVQAAADALRQRQKPGRLKRPDRFRYTD